MLTILELWNQQSKINKLIPATEESPQLKLRHSSKQR